MITLELQDIILLIFKVILIAINLGEQGIFYNIKRLLRVATVTALIYIGQPITLIIASAITIFSIKINKQRKLILNDIKNDFGSEKYKELQPFLKKNSLKIDNILDNIKRDIIRRTEMQLSIFILAMFLIGLCISPFFGAIFTLCTYLASAVLKSTLKAVLEQPYTKINLLNNIELELRIGNISTVNKMFKISNSNEL